MDYRNEIFIEVLIPREQQDVDLLTTAAQGIMLFTLSYVDAGDEEILSNEWDQRRWPESLQTFRHEVQLGKKDATDQWVPATPADCDAKGWIPAVFKLEAQIKSGEAIGTYHYELEEKIRFEIVNQMLVCQIWRGRYFVLREGKIERQ